MLLLRFPALWSVRNTCCFPPQRSTVHRPWTYGAAFIDCCLILIPFFPVPPVFLCNLPLFFRIFLPSLETSFLFLFIDLHPKFQDHDAMTRKISFHIVDLLICPFPLCFRTKVLYPFHKHTPVPCAVKNSDMSCFRQSRPETPQVMSCFSWGSGLRLDELRNRADQVLLQSAWCCRLFLLHSQPS